MLVLRITRAFLGILILTLAGSVALAENDPPMAWHESDPPPAWDVLPSPTPDNSWKPLPVVKLQTTCDCASTRKCDCGSACTCPACKTGPNCPCASTGVCFCGAGCVCAACKAPSTPVATPAPPYGYGGGPVYFPQGYGYGGGPQIRNFGGGVRGGGGGGC